jgi:hypothetical protein
MDAFVRLVLFLFAGVAGWIVLGLVGAFAGVAMDLLLSHGPNDPSLAWGAGLVGGLLGLVGAPVCLALRMRRNGTKA